MLVFIDMPQGKPKLAGNCDIPAPPDDGYSHIECGTRIGLRTYRIEQIGFIRRKGAPVTVIVLDGTDDPADLPGFREVDGRG